MREERIVIAGRELLIDRPDDAASLIDEERFAVDEFMPYWAELWPSGVALARHVATLDLRGCRVLELGCGLALPSFAAALAGGDVLATDWAAEALDLVIANAARNRIRVVSALIDWRQPGRFPSPPYGLVLAADVLYEERNTSPLLATLGRVVAADGEAVVADPGRRHAPAFLEAARRAGWSVRQDVVGELPHGWIAVLRRAATSYH